MKSSAFHKVSKPDVNLSPLAQSFFDSQCRIESKLDELLTYLKGPSVQKGDVTLQDAIRAHLYKGDRSLIDNFRKGKGDSG